MKQTNYTEKMCIDEGFARVEYEGILLYLVPANYPLDKEHTKYYTVLIQPNSKLFVHLVEYNFDYTYIGALMIEGKRFYSFGIIPANVHVPDEYLLNIQTSSVFLTHDWYIKNLEFLRDIGNIKLLDTRPLPTNGFELYTTYMQKSRKPDNSVFIFDTQKLLNAKWDKDTDNKILGEIIKELRAIDTKTRKPNGTFEQRYNSLEDEYIKLVFDILKTEPSNSDIIDLKVRTLKSSKPLIAKKYSSKICNVRVIDMIEGLMHDGHNHKLVCDLIDMLIDSDKRKDK